MLQVVDYWPHAILNTAMNERQQNEAEIVSDAAMLFNQNPCWLACEMRQTRETKHDRKGLHPSHPT